MECTVVREVVRRFIGTRTQGELAEQADIAANTLSSIMCGSAQRVSLRTVHKLANALGVPFAEFAEEERASKEVRA